MRSHDSATRAGRREWIGLAVLALPCVVYAMDLTVLNLALPSLGADLDPSATELLWIVDVYGFLVAGLLITMGTLGDRIGRRRLLLLGAAGFATASALAALATTPAMLIAARALLGVAGATIAPSTLSLIRTMFRDPVQRTFAVGIWATSFSAGAAIGPIAGGALLELTTWHAVFLPAVPVMAMLLAAGPRLLPEYRDPAAGRIDLPSAALSLAAVIAVVFGLKRIASEGADGPAALALAAGIALGVAFARRQAVLPVPLVDVRLFRVPAFVAALVTNGMSFFVGFGISVLIALQLQLVLGLSPMQAGLWTLPEAGGYVAGSMLAPVLLARLAPGTAVAAGLLTAAAGFATLAGGGDLASVVVATLVLATGLGVVATVAADLALSSVPEERAGAASALNETSSELGGALGIAVLGAFATAVYRAEAPVGAGDSIGAARHGVLDAARDAATQGLQLTAIVCVVVSLVAAALALTLLRQRASRAVAWHSC
jgi:DHA2 family multidrug resistance protein-like MFS transporter